jgi:hypothetical protein
MLSNILNSDSAIEVNIRIIGVFTKLKEYAANYKTTPAGIAGPEGPIKR